MSTPKPHPFGAQHVPAAPIFESYWAPNAADPVATTAPVINHAEEAAQAAKAGRWEIAQYHSTMLLAEAADAQVAATLAQTETIRIGHLIEATLGSGKQPDARTQSVISKGLGL